MATRTQPAAPLPAVDVPRARSTRSGRRGSNRGEAAGHSLIAEIIRIDALVEHARAGLKPEVAAGLRTTPPPTSPITFDEDEMPLADWRARNWSRAAEKFCDRNRRKAIEDGRKSFDTVHGRARAWQRFEARGSSRSPTSTRTGTTRF